MGRKDEKAERQRERVSKRKKAALKKKKELEFLIGGCTPVVPRP